MVCGKQTVSKESSPQRHGGTESTESSVFPLCLCVSVVHRFFICTAVALIFATSAGAAPAKRWFKGNLHTHTTESDGDSSPADVVQWYRDQKYDFLAITDHDKLTRLDAPGILLIPSEEVTDRLGKKPIHVNAIGIREVVMPQGGTSATDVLQRDIRAVRAAGGVPLINHPNFVWAFGADDIRPLADVTLMEIASGHPLVNSGGGGGWPSSEEIWDSLLTSGKRIYAVGVDDSHHFKKPGERDAAPGRAWVVVRAAALDQSQIVAALDAGDFYASTGPEIDEYAVANGTINVRVKQYSLNKYRIVFIGSAGRVLHTSNELEAAYKLKGGEGYVRVKVSDSNGGTAWLQPLWP